MQHRIVLSQGCLFRIVLCTVSGACRHWIGKRFQKSENEQDRYLHRDATNTLEHSQVVMIKPWLHVK